VKWAIVAVGRIKEPFYREAIAEYAGRLKRYRPIDLIEVPEERLTPGREAQVMRAEAERLRAACRGTEVIALTERGSQLDTVQLSQKLEAFEAQGLGALSFVLGGPQGLDPEFEREARWKMGLSALTLPYQLARLVLLEQLYRCETLRRQEPYHKA
jgi:23S rRNA (pseudouridine1915-N3)-methyltransferase